VFLQDANPLLTKTDDLVRIVEAVRRRFPKVRRITAYARSHTLARRSEAELKRLREAGLDRLHVGMESGCDAVLTLVSKGTTRAEQIEGGKRAKAAGFELSEYVMPGLGGRALSDAHADDTASALREIKPDFVRLRTTAVSPGTPLCDLEERGEFVPLGEIGLVAEIRRFLAGLGDLNTRLESDHVLNLLPELRGDLPKDRERLLGVCDAVLALPPELQVRFVLARRLGWGGGPEDAAGLAGDPQLDRLLEQIEGQGLTPEQALAQIRAGMV